MNINYKEMFLPWTAQKCVYLLPVSFPCFPHGISRLCSAVLLTFWATQAPSGRILIYFMERAIRPVTFPSCRSFSSRPQLCAQSFWFLNPSSALVVPSTLFICFFPAAEVLNTKYPELVLNQRNHFIHLHRLLVSVYLSENQYPLSAFYCKRKDAANQSVILSKCDFHAFL